MGQTPPTILTKEQEVFLDLIGQEKTLAQRFYLTGGTALAAFYLRHRYSEDIDLFSEEEFDIEPIRGFIKKAQKRLGATSINYQQFLGLHTFFLLWENGERLKIDFNYYPFGRIEHGTKYHNVVVDGVYDIAVNKVHTIVMKPRSRDFIDIYCIIKQYHYSFPDLLATAKIKFDWHLDLMQLGARLIEALDVKDYPRMIIKITESEWQDFFVNEAKKLKKDVLI